MESFLVPAASILRWTHKDVPNFVIRQPLGHGPAILSGLSFYLFFQAMSFIVIFGNGLLAALSTKVIAFLVGDGDKPAGAIEVLRNPLRGLVFVYVYFCIFRVLFLFGYSTWVAMWEMVYDFPTIQRIMIGRQGKGRHPTESFLHRRFMRENSSLSRFDEDSPKAAPNDATPKSEAGQDKISRASSSPSAAASPAGLTHGMARRHMVFMVPLGCVFILIPSVFLSAVGICTGWLGGAGQNFGCAFFDPAARLNRLLRFSCFCLASQFLQAWLAIFPRWHIALGRARWSTAQTVSVLLLSFLFPTSYFMLVLWSALPTDVLTDLPLPALMQDGLIQFIRLYDSNSDGHVSIQDFVADEKARLSMWCLAMMGWGFWIILTTYVIVKPENIQHSGFSISELADDSRWSDVSSRFKLTMWGMQGALVVHSCVASGVAHAQNDLVTFTVTYPLLFCIIWTVTFVIVRVSNYAEGRILKIFICFGAVALAFGAAGLCRFIATEGEGDYPVLIFFVWVSIAGEGLRVLRAWSKWMKSVKDTVDKVPRTRTQAKAAKKLARAATVQYSAATERGAEAVGMKIAVVVVRGFLVCVVSFCSVLGVCTLMATIQHRNDLYLRDIVWWRSSPTKFTLTNAGASVLSFPWPNTTARGKGWSPADAPQDYMLCGQTWHELQTLDYAIISELAYVRPTPENDLPRLLGILMPHVDISVVATHGGHGRRPWMEFEMRRPGKKPVSIVAVSGTVVDHVIDYLENIRMWTEPVVLTIINNIFPLTRCWSRETTALFIGSMHRMMGALGVKDQNWHYRDILQRVKEVGAQPDRDVVLTGHSLGGGIALVVGALTGQTVVAIQPPGVYHSLAKHQAVQEGEHDKEGSTALHKKSMSLVVEGDWIQNFDQHGGLVQTIPCEQKANSLTVGCHLLEGAICHLLKHCGDSAERFASCTHEYNPAATTMVVMRALMDMVRQGYESSRVRLFESTAQIQSMILATVAVSAVMVFRFAVPKRDDPLEENEDLADSE